MANETPKYPFAFCSGLRCQLPHILNAIAMAEANENVALQNAIDSQTEEESTQYYKQASKLKPATASANRMLKDFNGIQKPAICGQCPL